jgi:hypothetical protein
MDEILEKLELLRSLDKEFSVFGSNVHRYELNQPLSDIEFSIIEKKYGCTFPENYKHFITKVGNGGAGPFYGIFPITMQDDGHELGGWDGGYLIGDLSKPFQFTEHWNLPSEFWGEQPDPAEGTPLEIENKLWEEWDGKLEKEYWNTSIMNGAIPICHEGCALRDWLIITGQEAGNVWSDLRVDYEGIQPRKDKNGHKLDFCAWYIDWLDENLTKLEVA